MTDVDPKAFEYALGNVTSGDVFEKFAQAFLAARLDREFLPVGGMHDRGIDGLLHLFREKEREKYVFQASIQESASAKFFGSIAKLKTNAIGFESFTYVTNQRFSDMDGDLDKAFSDHGVRARIYDIVWFTRNINHSDACRAAYRTYIVPHLHEFRQPTSRFEFSDLEGDPRLYAFLRHEMEGTSQGRPLNEAIADGLILFGLEGTDPNTGVLRSVAEVSTYLREKTPFNPDELGPVYRSRFQALATKPRRINHHKSTDQYCLPYETRLRIQEREIEDAALHNQFQEDAGRRLRACLKSEGVQTKDPLRLLEAAIGQIFLRQGLDYANFFLGKGGDEVVERGLGDLIDSVVSESAVVEKNRPLVARALHSAIREIAYHGTETEQRYLARLSRTYIMCFVMRKDPKIATYFASISSNLRVFVCSSIIVPALSEVFLPVQNRRYWTLLSGAHKAGINLLVDNTILDELVTHIQKIRSIYERDIRPNEAIWLEQAWQFADEILLRGYVYGRKERQVANFEGFIETFVSYDLKSAREDLRQWLLRNFGIQFVTDEALNVRVNKSEEDKLAVALTRRKSSPAKARGHARLILKVHQLRARGNEDGQGGILGQKTWWLSRDSLTLVTVKEVLGKKFDVSPYLRPDFLYNYIALAPSVSSIEELFGNLFPGFLGVTLSYHVKDDMMDTVSAFIRDKASKDEARVRSILRRLGNELKSDPDLASRRRLSSYLDEHWSTVSLPPE